MPPRSIRYRFSVSLIMTIGRSAISFLTGIAVARGMGPAEFGTFTFLLGSFTSIRALFDMGSSLAFYTFISQKSRGLGFIYAYFLWQGLQFLVMLAFVGLLLPQDWLNLIWLGTDSHLVLAALAASFLQQQTWQTFTQLGDSIRKTHVIQLIGLGVVVAHLALVLVIWYIGQLGVLLLLVLICAEYAVASVLVWKTVRPILDTGEQPPTPKAIATEYWAYCSPLIIYSWFGFAYTFSDNWMLQYFGGSVEQGYYAVGNQFSALSLFATTAMLQILWKEVAEAHAKGNIDAVKRLHRKVSRLLFAVAALISGFLIPWSVELTTLTLGPAYVDGAPILALMLLYPMHQTMGQINNTIFFATSSTRIQVTIGIITALVGIPISYFVLAPTDATLPGFALGGLGRAIKLVVLTAVVVNLTSWWHCRANNWSYDWINQFQTLGVVAFGGLVSYSLANLIGGYWELPPIARGAIAFPFYCFVLAALLGIFPDIVGLSKLDVRNALAKANRLRMLRRQ